jgi:hypothetical protein
MTGLGSWSLQKIYPTIAKGGAKRREVISLQSFPTFISPAWREGSGVSRFSPFQTSRLARFGEADSFAAKQIESECQPVRLYSYCLAHAAP